MSDEALGRWFQEVARAADSRQEALETAWQNLESRGLLSRVTLHTWICRGSGRQNRGGGVIGRVIRVGETTIFRTRDYKQSRGLSIATSVPEARAKNTLDGIGHWPSYTFDVVAYARNGPQAGWSVECRHRRTFVRAAEVLELVRDTEPGKPGRPTLI